MMELITKTIEHLPEIIAASAQSKLGILALMIVVLAIIALAFFKNASTRVKVLIFMSLFLGFSMYAAAFYMSGEKIIACADQHVDVPQINVSTNSSDVEKRWGDNEIDSNDRTSVELKYNIEIRDENRKAVFILTWYAQERNENRQKGDTRFKSKKEIPLFVVDSKCPDLIIERLDGVIESDNREQYYGGQLRGFQSFPDTGSLKNIRVQVDDQGRHDNRVQALEAILPSFRVYLSKASK